MNVEVDLHGRYVRLGRSGPVLPAKRHYFACSQSLGGFPLVAQPIIHKRSRWVRDDAVERSPLVQ